ncbi:hypothetical protein SMI01S_28490 [Sphingobacterium mizutaii NBRC 14946 = DSM 11724]|uniref:Transcriptional activator FtrA n=2 Tax=Sphingobacterium mizutaii TaxID=1010 RepID=A0AAJ4XCA1_9SPHI|nr:DJ-1/PfpI family protein [Sphingobacterium mizutaii]GEM69243.1 hypothetical protein SMI01S_28490 [Sphingobacterium mizutaii NBRC 14946 = DSM 11724]SDL10818.1 DJ-1/PfpI family protein [Sphingobacterium mizutaii]SNV51537.1 transcriptional activator FtrA [Sphingobacterium mizutaii]
MKKILFLILFNLFQHANAQNHPENHEKLMDNLASQIKHDTINIGFLLFDGAVLQDFAGPMEVFSKAKSLSHGKYKTFSIGLENKIIKLDNEMLVVETEYILANAPKIDYLIIPGANMKKIEEILANSSLMEKFKKAMSGKNQNIISVCTAAYLLAKSDMLNNKKTTTHFFVAQDFKERFPKVNLITDVRFVEDGNIISSSGVTSGIDAALYLVEKLSGQKMRAMINRALQHDFKIEDKWPVPPNGMRYKMNNHE